MTYLRNCTIIIGENARDFEKRAAAVLQQNIHLVCGKKLPILPDSTPPADYELVVGKTNREALDGLSIKRSTDTCNEFIVKTVGKRLYMLGFGEPLPKPERYLTVSYRNNGGTGTLFAVYHVVEHILGYDFRCPEYADYPQSPDLPFPEGFSFEFTRARLRDPKIRLFEGAALYMLPVTHHLDWNVMSFVLRTKSGKLVVIDGGMAEETEVLLKVLRQLTPVGEKPHISAWLLSHMHVDHYGILDGLVRKGRAGEALPVTVEAVYWHLLPREFYATVSPERSPGFAEVWDNLQDTAEALGCRVVQLAENEIFDVDELSFKTLRVPDMKDGAKMNMNDASTVWRLTVDGGQTILFMGDAEWVTNNDLMDRHLHELKSDVVQVAHHGVANVSEDCYRAIDADIYLWQLGKRFYYLDQGEGLASFSRPVFRTLRWIRGLGTKPENIIYDVDGTRSFALPIEKK